MLTTGVRLSLARVEGEGQRRNLTRRPIHGVTSGCSAVPLDRSLRDGRPLIKSMFLIALGLKSSRLPQVKTLRASFVEGDEKGSGVFVWERWLVTLETATRVSQRFLAKVELLMGQEGWSILPL